MEYLEYLPHPALRSIVECYWSVRGEAPSDFWTVYPDTCMDILYNFGSFIESRDGEKTELSRSTGFIIGSMFTPIQSRTVGYTDIFGIRFHPAGIGRLLRVPLADFNDESVSLNDAYVFGRGNVGHGGNVGNGGPSAEQLESLSPRQRVHLLDRWLIRDVILSESKPEAWEYCLHKIVERSGNVNVYDLSREVGISQKQMERKFVEKVGPTPKQFAQLLKFRRLREYLDMREGKSLMEVAYDFGFTDSAHLTKFFRRFADVSPSEYLKN